MTSTVVLKATLPPVSDIGVTGRGEVTLGSDSIAQTSKATAITKDFILAVAAAQLTHRSGFSLRDMVSD